VKLGDSSPCGLIGLLLGEVVEAVLYFLGINGPGNRAATM
jgi:hypothetical protein